MGFDSSSVSIKAPPKIAAPWCSHRSARDRAGHWPLRGGLAQAAPAAAACRLIGQGIRIALATLAASIRVVLWCRRGPMCLPGYLGGQVKLLMVDLRGKYRGWGGKDTRGYGLAARGAPSASDRTVRGT